MSKRTTHSDLADLLAGLAEKLRAIPEGYCVSDPSTRGLLEDTAQILIEQDRRIEAATEAMRACRAVLPVQERQLVNEWLGAK